MLALLGLLLLPGLLFATEGGYQPSLIQFCTPVEFILFAVTLLGVALFHNHTLLVAVGGLAVIVAFKLIFTGFAAGPGWGDSSLTWGTSGCCSPICWGSCSASPC